MRTQHTVRSVVAVAALVGPSLAQSLRIYVIDVEQGASTLIVSPGGHTLLMDSGKNGHGDRIHPAMNSAGVTQIDHFVLSHYHEDHMGGIDDLIATHGITEVNAYDRGEKDDLEASKLSEQTYIDYHTRIGHRAAQLDRGETIPLDPAMTVTCVASSGMVIGETNPTGGTDENDMSVGLLIQFGSFRYFVGGDIEVTTEGKIAARDLVLDVDLYQANHHGAETSSSLSFMQDLMPTVVVISNGNHGGYDHPRQHTLDLLAGLSPAPAVFQTNKFFKGPPGGNVPDSRIADPQSTDTDGTILITVNPMSGQQVVSYVDASLPFPIKARGGTGTTIGGGMPVVPGTLGLVIHSLLPNPNGDETIQEEITLRNTSGATIVLSGWTLRDASGHAMSLAGQIAAGDTVAFLRNGAAITLNNKGDTITLYSPGNQPQDSFTYTGTTEGQRITTGH